MVIIMEIKSIIKIIVQTSYDIVKAHGGEISVVSEEGEGTGFTIHLSY